MRNRNQFPLFFLVVAAFAGPAAADADAGKFEMLQRQIQALQARIEALEATRTFASFMPGFSERFHVMHRAGEAGDWAVASHELQEMKRLSAMSISIDTEKGELMQGMMGPSFVALEGAITHGNGKKFEKALVQAINSCNACHTATGSQFIDVKPDAGDALSLRHPHRLVERAVPGGHDHGMAAAMKPMMPGTPTGNVPHDDTGKPRHIH